MSHIIVRGAKEHNLKNIDIDIPKNKLVTFTGPSGSGKSSLVFDTIYAESFRRFFDASNIPAFLMTKGVWSKNSRPKFDSIKGLPPALALSQRQSVMSHLSTVGTLTGISDLLRVYFARFGENYCHKCNVPLSSMSHEHILLTAWSYFLGKKVKVNVPLALKRKGYFKDEIEKFRDLGFSKISINDELFDLQDFEIKKNIDQKKLNDIEIVIDYVELNELKRPRFERAVLQALGLSSGLIKISSGNIFRLYNSRSACPQCQEGAPALDPRYFSHSSLGQCSACNGYGSRNQSVHVDLFPCLKCHGTRLSTDLPVSKVFDKQFGELVSMNLTDLFSFIKEVVYEQSAKDKSKLKVLDEILRILNTIVRLNLGYLNLNRSAGTLAPGDLQRLRLSTIIGNKLSGSVYVIDEPCQGLTTTEVAHLIDLLKEIVSNNAGICAVEHHPDFLKASEVLFTLGPGPGIHGGHIVENKEIEESEFFQSPQVSHQIQHPILSFENINLRNLKNKNVLIKEGIINVIRGPSGSGKSSFVDLCLLPYLNKIALKKNDEIIEEYDPNLFCDFPNELKISINSVSFVRPGNISRSTRRTVASAMEVVNPIRTLFSGLPLSQSMGLSVDHFSWNSKLGQCEKCSGKGTIELAERYGQKIKMQCEICLGSRFTNRSLVPRYKGLNISEVYNLSVESALEFFKNHRTIFDKLSPLKSFGLDYILLSQSLDQLSGGEMQRLNLTIELKKSKIQGTWFILFHPSTGLHTNDINSLGELMSALCAKGATVVAVENREEFIRFADNVIIFS